jgi:hypothetical protein
MQALSGAVSVHLREIYLSPFCQEDVRATETMEYFCNMVVARHKAGCPGLITFPTSQCLPFPDEYAIKKMPQERLAQVENCFETILTHMMPTVERVGVDFLEKDQSSDPLRSRAATMMGKWLLKEEAGAVALRELSLYCNGEYENDNKSLSLCVTPILEAIASGRTPALETLSLNTISLEEDDKNPLFPLFCRAVAATRLHRLNLYNAHMNFTAMDHLLNEIGRTHSSTTTTLEKTLRRLHLPDYWLSWHSNWALGGTEGAPLLIKALTSGAFPLLQYLHLGNIKKSELETVKTLVTALWQHNKEFEFAYFEQSVNFDQFRKNRIEDFLDEDKVQFTREYFKDYYDPKWQITMKLI